MGFKESIADTLGKISGKNIEDKISEYSEIYGEILLGMNREIETDRRLIRESRAEMDQIFQQTKNIQASISENIDELRKLVHKAEYSSSL